jgi:cytochrome b561
LHYHKFFASIATANEQNKKNMIKNTRTSYGSVSQCFHWLIAVGIITMLALGFIASNTEQKKWAGQLFWVHKSLGLTLLTLMLMRLLWRLYNTAPDYGPHIKRWQVMAAKSLHWGFYVVLFAMFTSGWITTSTGKHGVSFWGWFDATLPMTRSKATHHLSGDWHTALAWVIIGLIVVHVLAACKHHFVDRDDVLKRMLPSCPRKNNKA